MRLQVNYRVEMSDEQAKRLLEQHGAALEKAGITGPHALQAILEAHGTSAIQRTTAPLLAMASSSAAERGETSGDEATQATSSDSAALDTARPGPVRGHSRKADAGR